MTPRQTFELHQRLHSVVQGLTGAVSGESSEPSGALPSSDHAKKWACGAGMGLEKYACWLIQPGEVVGDEFTVDREVARDRWYTMLLESHKRGMLREIKVDGVVHHVADNADALRDFFDWTWKENCRKFEERKRAKESVTNGV